MRAGLVAHPLHTVNLSVGEPASPPATAVGAVDSFDQLSALTLPRHPAAAVSSAAAPGQLEPNRVLEPGARWHLGVITHHPNIAAAMRERYTLESLAALKAVLDGMGTLEVKTLPTGLPQAAESLQNAQTSDEDYDFVWTRDAAFVANAWRSTGDGQRVADVVKALSKYYRKPQQMGRMRRTIDGTAKGERGIDRPHIKFDGHKLIDGAVGPWVHAQNDALGLMLWLSFRSAQDGSIALDDRQLEPLAMLAAYLSAIDYSHDREAGHWEEMGERGGRVQASTLRCVLAGLQELKNWADADPGNRERLEQALTRGMGQSATTFTFDADAKRLEMMIADGKRELSRLLPLESTGQGIYRRSSDLALLSAIYLDCIAAPKDQLIDDKTRDVVIERFRRELRGSHGDRRYTGDGYWGAARGETDPAIKRVLRDMSIDERERNLEPGGETQWTFGASLLSAIEGARYQATGDERFLAAQTAELNRAVGMVTGPQSRLGPGTIPESYMQVRLDPTDAQSPWTFTENPLPLNWSKANLRLAMESMRQSLTREPASAAPAATWWR